MARFCIFLLTLLVSIPVFAADCFLNVSGSGSQNGSSAAQARPWNEGAGLRYCLENVEGGDTIHLAYGFYPTPLPVYWTKSGYPDKPIILQGAGLSAESGDFGESVLKARSLWPTIQGSRQYPITADTLTSGNDFLQFAKGVGNITIRQLNLKSFETPFNFSKGQNHFIDISDIYAENIRTFIYGVADITCDGKQALKLEYDQGVGHTPKLGAILKGATSGASGTVRNFEGDGKTGTLYLTDTAGFFPKNEMIVDGNQFQAQTTDSLKRVYSCANDRGSHDWNVSRVYMLGVSKKAFRSEGLRNIKLTDMYADVADPEGRVIFKDFPILWHFMGASKNITLTRIIGKHAGQDDATYDNGDCYATEGTAADITFNKAYCFDCLDGGYDLKGGPHTINDAVSFKNKRNYRFWHGPIYLNNSISGYAKKGQYSQTADGSGESIWTSGVVHVTHFTSINNPAAATFETNGHLRSLTYDGGIGNDPKPGTEIMGTISGASAKIAGVSDGSDKVKGKLFIFNKLGTFQINERVITSSGLNVAATSNGNTMEDPHLLTDHSIVALNKSYSTSSVLTRGKGERLSVEDVAWIEGISGIDPQFKNSLAIDWGGKTDEFNSALYKGTKGYDLPLQNDLIVKEKYVNFGTIPVNTQSYMKYITLSNSGSQPLIVQSLKITGNYREAFHLFQSPLFPLTLEPHASKSLRINFLPRSPLFYQAEIEIKLTNGERREIILKGIGGETYPNVLYRVNAGGNFWTDPKGNKWYRDEGFYNTGRLAQSVLAINKTDKDPLYQTERWDSNDGLEMSYHFPLPVGKYLVRLHFAETNINIRTRGMRVFDVLVENQTVLSHFNIMMEAGFQTALVKTFPVLINDGSLDIDFVHRIENPKISAIEILRSP
jgi:hypothetical protein